VATAGSGERLKEGFGYGLAIVSGDEVKTVK